MIEHQFLGFVYEIAFKLGFLKKDMDPNSYSLRKNEFLNYLEYEYLPKLEDGKEICELLNHWRNGVDVAGDPTKLSGIASFLYLLGYEQGSYFRNSLGENIQMVRYNLYTEANQAGNFRNADLMFVSNKILYVIDFKLGGAKRDILRIFAGGSIPSIPFNQYGVNINISTGKINFVDFLRSVLSLEELSFTLPMREMSGMLQLVSYATDYLIEIGDERKNIREINTSLYYPLLESFSKRFEYHGEDLSPYQDRIVDLYKRVKNLADDIMSFDGTTTNRERLVEENNMRIEYLQNQIKHKESEVEEFKPGSIKTTRDDVGEAIEEFFRQPDRVKVLGLLHSAGSGKTSQLLDKLLSLDGKHIVFYLTTRKVIADKVEAAVNKKKAEIEEATKSKKIADQKIFVIHEKRSVNNKPMLKVKGDVFDRVGSDDGILKRTCKLISDKFENHQILFAIATQQAILQGTLIIPHRDRSNRSVVHFNTTRHIEDMLSSARIISNCTVHFILDEVLGYKNGLTAVSELLYIMKNLSNRYPEFRANLYILDANLYSADILQQLLEEYNYYQVIPSAMVMCSYKSKANFEYDGIQFYCYTKHGYPANHIYIRRKFLKLKSQAFKDKKEKHSIEASIADYIRDTFMKDKNDYTAMVFIQDKNVISEVNRQLKQRGFSTVVVTTDSRKTQEEINKESSREDVIIMTSALSRGIDIARNHKPVKHIYLVNLGVGIEQNLAEVIQVISRARGSDVSEDTNKHIHLVYGIKEVTDEYVKSVIDYLSEDGKGDEELVKLILKRITYEEAIDLDFVVSSTIKNFLIDKEGRALIPIPTQHTAFYVTNNMSQIESAVSFLDGLSRMLDSPGNELITSKLDRMTYLLKTALTASVLDLNLRDYQYYHPYLLFDHQPVLLFLDKDKRSKILEVFDEHMEKILHQHNQERADEVTNLIKHDYIPATDQLLPVIVPSYAVIITNYFLQKEKKIEFIVGKRIGRGEASTMMGSLSPITYCANAHKKEYACIPLGEDYPYKEVLSGRFAKYPIFFLRLLLEKGGQLL